MRALRTMIAVLAALTTLAAPVTATGGTTVAGSYRYSPFDATPTRAVSIRAHANEGGVGGSWQWTNLLNGTTRSGAIICLVVDGSEAWLAGPDSTPGDPAGAFFRIHDGGAPGTEHDETVAFIGDPGQTLEELEAWCREQTTDISLFPIDEGNLVVHAGP